MRKQRRRRIPRVPPNESPADPNPFPTTEDITALAQEMLVSHRPTRTSDIYALWRAAETELLNRAARRVLALQPSS